MDIEQLNIQVDSDIRRADSGLQALTSKINTLASAMGKIERMNTQSVSNSLNTFSHAMQRMSSVKAPDYNRLAKGLDRLGNVNHGNIQSVANALTPFSASLNMLNNATFDNKNIQNLINSLTRLSNANVGNLQSINLANLGNQISAFSSQMQNAPQIDKNVIQFTNAISNLARYGQNIPTVNASLSSLGNEMIHFMSAMANAPIVASETTQFAMAIGQLASAGQNTGVTAANLSTLATELSKFMGVMSKAPVVSQNTIQMTQALANLSNAGKTTIRNTNGMRTFFDVLTSGSNKSAKSVKSLAYYFGKLYANFFIIIRLFNLFKKSIDFASDLTEVQNIVDTTFGSMSQKVEEFASTSIQSFGMSELTAKTVAGQFQAMGTAMGISNQQVKQATEYLNGLGKTVNGLSYGYDTASNSMADMSLNLTKLAADMGSFYNKEYGEVAEQLQSGVMSGNARVLRQYGLDLTQATVQEWALKHGLDANMKSMSQSEKVMLRYQYVMANTGAAQGDFAKTSMTWANSVRMLKQNFQQFGAVIGRMAIQVFKPFVIALNKVILSFTKLAQKVSDSLGVIFGWKYEDGGGGAISDLGDDTEDFANGLDDATDSAKKLKQQLQGFDELNVLTTPQATDTGGGYSPGASSGGASSGKEGEWVKVPHNFDSELDTLYKLGDAINNKLQDVMESIDWDKIYRKASNFGTGLADFLNGLISPELFYDVGMTVANCLNTAIIAFKDFWGRLDGVDIGKSIAAGINGFFDNIKAEDLAQGINNMVHTIEDVIVNALTNIKWGNIWDKVVDLWSNLDWDTKLIVLGFAISKGLKKAFDSQLVKDAIANAISNSGVTTTITNYFKNNPVKIAGLGVAVAGISLTFDGVIGENWLEASLGAAMATLGAYMVSGNMYVALGALILTFGSVFIKWTQDPDSQGSFKRGLDKLLDSIRFSDGTATTFDGKEVELETPLSWKIKELKWDFDDAVDNAIKSFEESWRKFKSRVKDFFSGKTDIYGNELTEEEAFGEPAFDLPKWWENTKEKMKDFFSSSEPLMLSAEPIDFDFDGFSKKIKKKVKKLGTDIGDWWKKNKPEFDFDIKDMTNDIKNKVTDWGTKASAWWKDHKPNFDFDITDIWNKLVQKVTGWRNNIHSWWDQHRPQFNFNIADLWGRLSSTVANWRNNIHSWWDQHRPQFNFNITDIWGRLSSTVYGWRNNIANWWNANKPSFNFRVGILEKWEDTFNYWRWYLAVWWNDHKPNFNFGVDLSAFTRGLRDALNTLVYYVNVGVIFNWNNGWGGNLFRIGYLPSFAQGGITSADIFMANENGVPELIGTMGGKTAIASGTEVTGISNAVYETSGQQVKLLQQQNQLLTQILAKETGISSDDLFNSVRNSARNYQNRTGNPAFGY